MANPNGPWPTVTKWKPEILAAAKKYGVNPSILAAVVQHESGGREGLTSSAGAKGLTQFMPGTAASYGVNVAPGHALSQIEGTAHYLKDLGVNKDPLRALAAYGAGPGNIPGGMGYARADLAISKNYRGLDGQTLGAPVTPGASGTRTRTTTKTVPGTDNSAARRDLIAQFVMQGGPSNDNALIGLASGLQGAQDTPSKTVKVRKTTAGSVAPATDSSGYVNPFAGSLKGPGRIDEGVDPVIHGPIRAIGDAKVVNISHNFYKGQPYIVYQLQSGPHAGKYVYVSELVTPHVKQGQTVRAGDVIATGNGAIETGWAGGAQGGYMPLANRAQGGSYTEGAVTGPGRSFAALLKRLGANAATGS